MNRDACRMCVLFVDLELRTIKGYALGGENCAKLPVEARHALGQRCRLPAE